MSRKVYLCCSVVLSLAGLVGCSGGSSSKETKKTVVLDRIQGKTQIMLDENSSNDVALNAGGQQSTYILTGARRYRLFFLKPYEVQPGKEYVVEGIHAQKVIDELGDPDNGKNGYPLESRCDRIVRMAWPGQAFDVTDLASAALKARVKRFPARPVFLVVRIKEAEAEGADAKKDTKAADAKVPEIDVPADKQKALLVEGAATQPAPLWKPEGGTAKCKVQIDTEGKVSELQTGAQLCESVPWTQFKYQPTVQKGKPVKVNTEVEVNFEPRKQS